MLALEARYPGVGPWSAPRRPEPSRFRSLPMPRPIEIPRASPKRKIREIRVTATATLVMVCASSRPPAQRQRRSEPLRRHGPELYRRAFQNDTATSETAPTTAPAKKKISTTSPTTTTAAIAASRASTQRLRAMPFAACGHVADRPDYRQAALRSSMALDWAPYVT